VLTFNQGNEKIKRLSEKLLRHLSLGYLNTTLEQTRQDMGDSWTTINLNKSMRKLTKLAINLAEEVTVEATTIKKHADDLYQLFCSKHGFEKTQAISLNLDSFIQDIQSLEKITHDFCTDPVNMLTEKHFLIRRFYLGLVTQIQALFEQAQVNCTIWLNVVIGELKTQINVHKKALDKRAETLMESDNNADNLIKNLEATENEFAKLMQQSNQIDAILLKLMRCAKFNIAPPSFQ
jgi:hypothetical protein